MFLVAFFTTAKIWKQVKCSSTDEWINKMWYIYIIYVFVCVFIYIHINIILYIHTYNGILLSHKEE